jgi:hypothetical protein
MEKRGTTKPNTKGGVTRVKKSLVLFVAAVLVLSIASVALAADITPKTYQRKYNDGTTQTVTHPYGFWNDPTTAGRDTYNYNNVQDYSYSNPYSKFKATPHGNYTTSTHKCRECHAVHRAAGKFKLLRADSRVEACDWCHGLGAGSGANIQMDNDDAYTQEYNVGHTMGFGTADGKFKAPDDTYPAYTPKYYMGGFSCIDCHSPHGNPQRILGGYPKPQTSDWNTLAAQRGITYFAVAKSTTTIAPSQVTKLVIANPGHYPQYTGDTWGPTFSGGKWILVENPDVELRSDGTEIKDWDVSAYNGYPVNKMAYDWDFPFGPNNDKTNVRVVKPSGSDYIAILTVNEFCADCHDGNAGRSTLQTKLFSEERALRGDADPYDIGYGHDTNPRH